MSNVRRKRTFTPIILGALSLAQIGVGLMVAAFVLLNVGGQPTCQPPPLVVSSAQSPRTLYVDLTALFARPASQCAQASQLLALSTPPTDLLAPFVAEAQRRRAERWANDPTFAARMDPVLNRERINFLFFGYGETYEPPYGPDFKGSINIFSLDLRTHTIATVTLNHDIRAPEVERFRATTDGKRGPTKIDQAYPVGGFDVMRVAVEDATGLAIDFQLAMADGAILRAVDDLFGGIVVDVPFDFDALPIYFEGAPYPALHYPAGRERLNGLQALQFIKALNGGAYDRDKELTVRKQIIVKAMAEAAKREAVNPLFWTKAFGFLRGELDRRAIVYDFDPSELLAQSLQQTMARGTQVALTLPTIGASVYVVDEQSGDGGVEWITGSANPIIQQELANGVYADYSMSVPKGDADPYALDLVANYWPAVRALV
ncbi:MAG: LCP family protein, partial [Chloroflexota bacterium]